MFAFIWPIVLVVLANVLYQICTKSVPAEINPFASLIFTYLTSAAATAVIYFLQSGKSNLIEEYGKLNWTSYVLGLSIVALEAGWIYAYKAGWEISKGFIVQSAFISLILLGVGYLLYQEAFTWNKALGAAVCLIGLALINYK
ncbi:hypothetical protein IJT93_13340 [bacterium]|nr:hypothetical protein [bacterium]